MYKLIILIEPPEDVLFFEKSWPMFLKQAERMPGLVKEATIRVNKTLFGAQQVAMIHELYFESHAELQTALTSPVGQAAGQLLHKVTLGKMTLLSGEHREDHIENIRKFHPAADENP